jgi:hypothetical protein
MVKMGAPAANSPSPDAAVTKPSVSRHVFVRDGVKKLLAGIATLPTSMNAPGPEPPEEPPPPGTVKILLLLA